MTKLVPCEPFEAEVWDDNENYKAKGTVYGFINGLPIVEWYGTYYYSTYLHYKKIDPEYVPLDSTDEIPNWCFGLWLFALPSAVNMGRLLQIKGKQEIMIGWDSSVPFGGKAISLVDAFDQKLEIQYKGNEFKFYKEKK